MLLLGSCLLQLDVRYSQGGAFPIETRNRCLQGRIRALDKLNRLISLKIEPAECGLFVGQLLPQRIQVKLRPVELLLQLRVLVEEVRELRLDEGNIGGYAVSLVVCLHQLLLKPVELRVGAGEVAGGVVVLAVGLLDCDLRIEVGHLLRHCEVEVNQGLLVSIGLRYSLIQLPYLQLQSRDLSVKPGDISIDACHSLVDAGDAVHQTCDVSPEDKHSCVGCSAGVCLGLEIGSNGGDVVSDSGDLSLNAVLAVYSYTQLLR